jgi:hypothetical protein
VGSLDCLAVAVVPRLIMPHTIAQSPRKHNALLMNCEEPGGEQAAAGNFKGAVSKLSASLRASCLLLPRLLWNLF